MTKITFRADDGLVERLDGLDTSKSEVMREALRTYLDAAERDSGSDAHVHQRDAPARESGDIDGALSARIDELVAVRLEQLLPAYLERELDSRNVTGGSPPDVNVNINVDGNTDESDVNTDFEEIPDAESVRKTPDAPAQETTGESTTSCDQCGESVDEAHVYCPNCGEKASHRVFCECGDELRSDWAFCPGCGRRTPAADVLEQQ